MYLQHLSLRGFRGIGQPLDLGLGRRTIIYGPNGSGKTSILQAIPWAIYGKVPTLAGNVFAREDALVNDFLDEARAAVTLTLSDGTEVARTRKKQTSTSKGPNPLTVSVAAEDPQVAIEQLIGLNLQEFFAAVLLHQETIRGFITTTADERSATIDRMIGTYLLRALIKVVDPGVPASAIEKAEREVQMLEQQMAQATVISREVLQRRREEWGDPGGLPELLGRIRQDLVPLLKELQLPIPGDSCADLGISVATARQTQLEESSKLEERAGDLVALKERYQQAAVVGWQTIRQQKEQFGDSAELPGLIAEIQQALAVVTSELTLPAPSAALAGLGEDLESARRAQSARVSELQGRTGALSALKERYQQAAVTNWQMTRQRRAEHGDPALLPALLLEAQSDLAPIAALFGLQAPEATLASLEASLASVRRIQPGRIGELEQEISQLRTLKGRYEQVAREVVEDTTVPPDLAARRTELQTQVAALNQEIPVLRRRIVERGELAKDLGACRHKLQELPSLQAEVEQLQAELARLEADSKQAGLHNQVTTAGQEYLVAAQPEHCPICGQQIADLQAVLDSLRQQVSTDVGGIREEIKRAKAALAQKQTRVEKLEREQEQVQGLETALGDYPVDLEAQVQERQKASARLADELAAVETEIAQIEARIRLAQEHRSKLKGMLQEIERALGQRAEQDVAGLLDQRAQSLRVRATEIQALDFQAVGAKLDNARQLAQIEKEESQLQEQLDAVLKEVECVLAQPLEEDVAGLVDQAIGLTCRRVAEVQALDLRPIATALERARSLDRIREEEAQLQRRLEAVRSEVEESMEVLPDGEPGDALEQAIQSCRHQAVRIRALDFQTTTAELERAKQLEQIQQDEARLRELEACYQTVIRQKERLQYRIERLVELRNALQDIAQTAKQRQQEIVIGLLGALDIDFYYRQLDPHPAYRQLQIEPELTSKGTYSYWIKALTDDRSHGTYVQTRFSTAQANSAAIAIFLAVNQHLSRSLETIILDDPSQSMDPDHRLRLAQTLAASPRQVIVATEDPQMLECLAQSFEAPVIHQLDRWTVNGAGLAGLP